MYLADFLHFLTEATTIVGTQLTIYNDASKKRLVEVVVVIAPQRELEPSQHLVQLLGEYLCIVERDGRRSFDGLAAFEATQGSSSSNRPSVRCGASFKGSR